MVLLRTFSKKYKKNIKTYIHSLKVMIWEGQKAAEGQPRPGGPEIYSFGPQPEFRL